MSGVQSRNLTEMIQEKNLCEIFTFFYFYSDNHIHDKNMKNENKIPVYLRFVRVSNETSEFHNDEIKLLQFKSLIFFFLIAVVIFYNKTLAYTFWHTIQYLI